MKNKLALFFLALSLLASATVSAQIRELERSTPEAEGVPSGAVIALMDSLMGLPKTDIHSVMVLRHGKVIAEAYPAPFAPEYRHTVFSCSKTFVSAAVGLAISENRLRLTDRVASFFPDQLPDSISANLADMTVRNLLNMTSGVTPDWNMRNVRTDWIKGYLGKQVKVPGEHFDYDSMSSYILSAIVQKVTGMKVLDYLRMKLFEPMHITDISWEVSPEGINTGGWGVYIQSESLAKFGQLLLNRGVWKGKQLLPAWWVDQMMAKQSDTGSFGYGYGYHMWLCEYPGAIRMDGALGQYVLIIPDKDMVVVITECTLIDGVTQRRLVWNHLLPAVVDSQPLILGKDYKRLQKKQSSYQLPVVRGKATSSLAGEYADKSIMLESNKFGWQSFNFRFKQKEVIMTVTETDGIKYDLAFGYKQWRKSSIEAYPPYSIEAKGHFNGIEGPFYVAGSYAWPFPSTLELKAHYVNWITALNLAFRFDGEDVQLTVKENYSSEAKVIKGKVCD
ncbi:MAG: serine hydrolase [Bacteroides oleiciplenus]|uniref:Class C beta-lactamase-related serine hydrolase n=1 Tax=Bacteroides stercorirosoris TaxID=871324 RepID=A0A413H4K8_9BACE|nr:serine hydrolase [Bacteroides stercorirosoris]OKZ10419.1 MAG: serine hydrolase [Bacteroides oleiciplenus]RGX78419.1 class C beta-lactamase-related serine hydrolase [Bacteroides stercorirosoris]